MTVVKGDKVEMQSGKFPTTTTVSVDYLITDLYSLYAESASTRLKVTLSLLRDGRKSPPVKDLLAVYVFFYQVTLKFNSQHANLINK